MLCSLKKIVRPWFLLPAITMLMTPGAMPTAGADEGATIVSRLEFELNLGTVCRFGTVTWTADTGVPFEISIATGSAGVPTFGGFWGRRYTDLETVSHGETILSPDGRTLKLQLTLRGPASVKADPPVTVSVAYQPLASTDDTWGRFEITPSMWHPKQAPVDHIALSDEVVTPHVVWAKPSVKGPVRVLFLVSFDMQREIIELDQRFDMTFDAPTYVKYGNRWADASVHRYQLRPEAVIERTAKLLDDNTYDTVVVAGLEWMALGAAVRERLLKRIESGMGAVICMDPTRIKGSEALAALTPLSEFAPGPRTEDGWSNLALIGEKKGTLAPSRDHFITAGVPLEALPSINYFPYKKAKGVLVVSGDDPVAAIGQHGRGRVVQFAWSNPDYWGGTCAITPSVDGAAVDFPTQEYFLSQVARAILWSARREPDVRIHRLSHRGQTISATSAESVEVALENTRTTEGFAPRDPVTVATTMTLRDRRHTVVDTQTTTRHIDAGDIEVLAFPLPPSLAGGLHFADLVVRINDKVENWGTAFFTVNTDVRLAALTVDHKRYTPGDRAEIRADIDGDVSPGNFQAQLRVYDTYGRLLDEAITNVARQRVEWDFGLDDIHSHFQRVEVTLLRDGQIVDYLDREIEVAYPHRWDDYQIILWGFVGTQITGYVRPLYFDAFRDMGITSILDAVESPAIAQESARANFGIQPIGGVGGTSFSQNKVEEAYAESKDKNVLVRKTCLSNPDYWSSIAPRMGAVASTYGWLGPTGYNLGDEFALIHTGVPTRASQVGDICFSPHCIKRFSAWLRDRYGTLEALNQQWGSTWSSWEEVRGATRHAMRDVVGGNYAPWADHRTFMDDVFVTAFERWQGGLAAVDPAAKIGMSGQSPPSCYNGFDYSKLSRAMRTMNMYIWISQGELWSSLAPGHAYTHWTGYGQPDSEILAGIWFSVAQQHHGISYYKVPWFVTPDLRLNRHARFIRDNIRPIKEGIGKIAMSATKDYGQIAILYSQPSLRAAWITSAGLPMARESIHEYHERDDTHPDHGWDEVRYLHNLDAYCMLLKSAGLGYRFVSDDQIDQGALEAGNYQAIILPFAMAISDQTAGKIRRFVEAGGMAVSDVAPGVMDEHCTTRQGSVLADLFGFDIVGTEWSREPTAVRGRNEAAAPLRNYAAEALGALAGQIGTGLPRAVVEVAGQAVPAMVHHTVGKGRAVFFNFFLSHLNDRVTWQRDRDLLLGLFGDHGIDPQCTMAQAGERLLHYESTFLDHGPLRYLVLRRWDHTDTLDDGRVEVTVPAPAHLYDVREGRYLGHSDRLETTLPPGDGRFYALLPYQVHHVTTEVDPSHPAPGDTVTWQATVATGSSHDLGPHVMRVVVLGPDGKARHVHTRNIIAEQGVATGHVPLALNAAHGTWQIEVTDVASGRRTASSFVIK